MFTFCLQPVIEIMACLLAAFEVTLVGARSDLLIALRILRRAFWRFGLCGCYHGSGTLSFSRMDDMVSSFSRGYCHTLQLLNSQVALSRSRFTFVSRSRAIVKASAFP